MTFKEQEQFTKKNSYDLLSELINYQGENLISEIVRLGIQNLMELERDEHIGVGNYERGEDRRSQRNGYKSRQLYTRVGSLVLQVPQTRDGAFIHRFWSDISVARRRWYWPWLKLICREYQPAR